LVKKLLTCSAVNKMLPISCFQVGQSPSLGACPSLTTQTPEGSDSCSFVVNEEHDNVKH